MRLLAVAVTALAFAHGASAAAPPFVATVHSVSRAELGHSWHTGCPVGPASLVRLRLSYWNFAAARRLGDIVVARSAAHAVVAVFATLYGDRFPIRSIRPVAAFRGSDDLSMAADSTAAMPSPPAPRTGPRTPSA
jgi:hypothetical protein